MYKIAILCWFIYNKRQQNLAVKAKERRVACYPLFPLYYLKNFHAKRQRSGEKTHSATRNYGVKIMATTVEYIEYVCEQIKDAGRVRYRKMFGEYMAYVNDKPVLLVCDNTVFVKKLDCIAGPMQNADTGIPYPGAKEHYILDIDDGAHSSAVAAVLETVTPRPNPKKPKPR